MIRLGSLAGYPFEGPRLLGGWTPPARPAVFAILIKPDAGSERYAVIYVGHADDLSAAAFPFSHPAAECWAQRAGGKWKIYVAWYEIPGGLPSHREQITKELVSIYHPGCNEQQYDKAWREEWIQDYNASTTGPLTTNRTPTDPT
jgi:hypothetical protein